MSDIVQLLLSILRVAWPLPASWTDVPELTLWLARLNPVEAEIISRIVANLQPAPGPYAAADQDAIADVVLADLAADGDKYAKIDREKIKALLDLILKILPFILPLLGRAK